MKIGILGGKGMLGTDLAEFLGNSYETTPIDKDNYSEFVGSKFDIFINANGNSRRFWANEHPLEDFEASTVSVYKSFSDFSSEKYFYISSPDVYENPGSPEFTKENQEISPRSLSFYGFHKYLSERIVEHYAGDYFILRCAALLGTQLKKGPVYDIVHDTPSFITADSEIQFIGACEVARIIESLMTKGVKNEIFNAAGKGAVSAEKIAELAGKKFSARDDAATLRYEMSAEKIQKFFPVKSSEEYLKEYLSGL